MFRIILLLLLVPLYAHSEDTVHHETIDIEQPDSITIDTKQEVLERKIINEDVLNQWKIGCKLKKSGDIKSCRMRKFVSQQCPDLCMVSIELDSNSGLGVQFAFSDSPHIAGQIKFSKNDAEEFEDYIIRGNQAERILKKMQSKKTSTLKSTDGKNHPLSIR